MDPISALIGAGASLIGGFMNSSSASSIASQNIQEAQWAAQGGYLPGLVANARKAGLSPLAVLGNSAPSMPVNVGSSPGDGLVNAGKILADMKLPGASAPSKLDQLQGQLLESQIRRTDAETNSINSHLSVATQPGVRPGSDPAHAIPAFSWFTDDKGRPFLGQSKEFAGTQFGVGSWPSGVIAGAKTVGENIVQAGKSLWDDLPTIRPDILRSVSPWSYSTP